MEHVLAPASQGYRSGTPRERVVSSVLSAAIIVAAVLLALSQSGVVAQFGTGPRLVAFDIAAAGSSPKAAARIAPPRPALEDPIEQQRSAMLPRPRIVIPNPEARTSDDFGIPGFIRLTRPEMAASDIGRMKGTALAAGSGRDGTGTDGETGTGDGPGGATLHNADWFRKPTDAELAGYLPRQDPGSGWGMIACRTVADHRVEDCRILGESPGGSGYGRAVLNAAWQFQVLPPRVNARPQLGTWVRIRIEYSERGARAG